MSKQYNKWPRLERASNGQYYAYYLDANGRKQRKSLKERNELRAQAKFTRLLEDVDRGVLGFSRVPQVLPFDEMVARYLAEGVAELSPQSVRRHKQVFKNQLLPYFKKISVKAIGPRELVRYVRMRRNAGVAPNTLHKEIAALSAVFNFLAAEELIPLINPTKAIKKPKIRQIRPHYVPSGPELERIFQHLYPGARLFFLALCNTGCRLAEIQNTNVSDADFEQRLLRVIRKGRKIDYVPLNETLLDAIRQDIEQRSARPDDPLFLNNHGKRYLASLGPFERPARRRWFPYDTPRIEARLCHSLARVRARHRNDLQAPRPRQPDHYPEHLHPLEESGNQASCRERGSRKVRKKCKLPQSDQVWEER